MLIIIMWETVSDIYEKGSLMRHILSKETYAQITVIAVLDLIVIIPSIVLFLAFNIKLIDSFGLPFLVTVLSFLFYLPLGIFYSSYFLSRRGRKVVSGGSDNRVLPAFLFLLLTFVMIGVYTPSIGTLTHLIPSISFLNVTGFVVVFMNLIFIVKVFPVESEN